MYQYINLDFFIQRGLRKLSFLFSRTILTFLFLTLITSEIIPQEGGVLTGTIVDKQNGEALIGTNVFLEGTNLGAATDIEGAYRIANVPPGTYNLIVSMIGYSKVTVTGVQVKSGEVSKYDISLAAETIETDEVVITAEMILDNEASLLKNRQKSISVSDAISSEEISRSGSSNAGDAMNKVTGASVIGGKYVYVRGLGERYSSTQLNGSELPSADPDKKSFQLDLIPGNMLNNIITIKTFTPDKPGTFTGGLVDITLKSYPEAFSFQVSGSTGYNSVATGNDKFILGNSGGTDWLGFDDGTRKLPGALNGGSIDIPRPNGVSTKDGALELDKISKSFNTFMAPVKSNAPLNSSFNISTGNTLHLNETSSIGYFGSLTWGQSYSLIDNGEVGRYKLVGNLSDVTGLEAEFKGTDLKGTRSVDWGGIGNLAYKNSSLGEIKFSYMRTQSASSTGRYLLGVRDRDRSTTLSTTTFETRVISWVERALDNYQLNGEHVLSSLGDIKLDWKASYSINQQDEPDQRYFFNIFNVQPDGSLFYSFDGANTQPISRYFRDLEEKNTSGQIDFTVPFRVWDNQSANVKTGFFYSHVNREYNQRRFDYLMNGLRFNDYNGDIDLLFQDVGIIDSTSRPNSPNRWFGITIDNEAVKDSTNYFRGKSDVNAAYVMIDLPLINKLRFIGGARLETTDIASRTLDTQDAEGNLNNTDILPSINLIYSIDETMNLRLAYTNTIARPTFRELAPYLSFEFVGDFLYRGNPNLKRTLVTNYDIRWEWFLNPGEILAVSGFYKDFTDPIESFIDPTFSDDNTLRSVKNVDNARVYGLEFEFRKGLGFITSFLDNFALGTNLSLVESKTKLTEQELVEKKANGDPNPDTERPFVGQSPYLFNLNLTYGNIETNTSAGIYYYLFGDRLFVTGRHATPDVYERGYGALDVKATQGIGDHFELSLSAKNLLNPLQKFSYELDNGKVNREFIYTAYKKGISLALSVSYKL